MLTINFSQQFNEHGQQEMSWQDPILTIDGEEYDLSLVPDGATAVLHEVLHWVKREGSDYIIEVQLNCAFKHCPESTRFPEQQVITENGEIDVPVYEIIPDPEPEPEPEEM
jgi:hypothetical protein